MASHGMTPQELKKTSSKAAASEVSSVPLGYVEV